MKKYKLTNETIVHFGFTLYRIEALMDFSDVKAGDKGGFVQSENNLSQLCNAWVYGNAKVYGNAFVCDYVKVCGDADVYGKAEVRGDAKVYKNSDYIVFKNWWSSGRYFTWTRSNKMWKVGCFYGNGEELIKKAYADSEESGREYERVVRYVENILADELNK